LVTSAGDVSESLTASANTSLGVLIQNKSSFALQTTTFNGEVNYHSLQAIAWTGVVQVISRVS
jgi:hypothetical protein